LKPLTKEKAEKQWAKMKNKGLFFERYQLPEEVVEDKNHEIVKWLSVEFSYSVIWHYVSKYKGLTEKFLSKHKKKFKITDWTLICCNNQLTEQFIEKHKEYINWRAISANQILSETFIEQFSDYVFWNYIAEHQLLSRDFVIKNLNRLEIHCLLRNEKLSYELKDELKMIHNMSCGCVS
jgi:hypothetical protein